MQGLATLYDVSEAIVGEVPTLDEPDDLSVVRRADGTWLLGGSLAIEEFKEIFGIRSLPGEGRHYRTLAGFLMMQLGRIPTEGEHFVIADACKATRTPPPPWRSRGSVVLCPWRHSEGVPLPSCRGVWARSSGRPIFYKGFARP